MNMDFFKSENLPEHLKEISAVIESAATKMDANLVPSAEKSAGMRKLLEAKDCFVRSRLEEAKESHDTIVDSNKQIVIRHKKLNEVALLVGVYKANDRIRDRYKVTRTDGRRTDWLVDSCELIDLSDD